MHKHCICVPEGVDGNERDETCAMLALLARGLPIVPNKHGKQKYVCCSFALFLPSVYWYAASYLNYEERNVMDLAITRRDPGEE